MKAVLTRRYGPPESVTLEELPQPVPGPGEVLVRVRATTLSAADMRLRAGRFPYGMATLGKLAVGIRGPRRPVLGVDLAGEVAATGPGVAGWKTGDAVIAFPGARLGCHAEYRLVPQTAALVAKPAGLDWPVAAALVFGGSTALWFLRDQVRLQTGESLLVVGASGAVGSAAVQIGRLMGARVTGVTSTPNTALVAGLGAEEVIDYRAADWAALGRRWDVILDTTSTVPIARARPCLPRGGRLALVNTDLPQMLTGFLTRDIKVRSGVAPERAEILSTLAAWAADGRVVPHVSATFPLEQAAAAHAIADSGRKVGSVVLLP